MIAVKGNTITMDTMGCQRSHVDIIHARGGWYVLQWRELYSRQYSLVGK